jgi:hypothetical protein
MNAGVHQRPTLTLERETFRDCRMAQDQVPALESADVLERRLSDDLVARQDRIGSHAGLVGECQLHPTFTFILCATDYLG